MKEAFEVGTEEDLWAKMHAVGGEIDVEFVADTYGLDLGGFASEGNVGDILFGVVGELHA